jgi:hypothetical protein
MTVVLFHAGWVSVVDTTTFGMLFIRLPNSPVASLKHCSDAGVAAVWLVRRPGSAWKAEETSPYKRGSRGWEGPGGGTGIGGKGIGPAYGILAARPSAARDGPGSILTHWGGGGSYKRDGIVCGEHLRVATEVEYIQAGKRRISVPEHGCVLIVWKSASGVLPSGRPRIVAAGRDGTVLTELGPEDYFDSLTMAILDDESPPEAACLAEALPRVPHLRRMCLAPHVPSTT